MNRPLTTVCLLLAVLVTMSSAASVLRDEIAHQTAKAEPNHQTGQTSQVAVRPKRHFGGLLSGLLYGLDGGYPYGGYPYGGYPYGGYPYGGYPYGDFGGYPGGFGAFGYPGGFW